MGKKYEQARAQLETRPYGLEEAVNALRTAAYAGFDETVELHLRLGVDPRKADQMVRGAVTLPKGTGKTVRVLVVASGEKALEAREAGADFVEGPEVIEKIREGWLDFDAVIATPDMMRELGKVGKILGPRGLMPSPKTGTVTLDVARAVREVKAGRVEFRVDKTANLHVPIGKRSFPVDHLVVNAVAVFDAVQRAKPAAARGRYLRRAYLCTTMSPSVELDLNDILTRVKI